MWINIFSLFNHSFFKNIIFLEFSSQKIYFRHFYFLLFSIYLSSNFWIFNILIDYNKMTILSFKYLNLLVKWVVDTIVKENVRDEFANEIKLKTVAATYVSLLMPFYPKFNIDFRKFLKVSHFSCIYHLKIILPRYDL